MRYGMVFLSILLFGCGTVTPKPIVDHEAAFDATTPVDFNSQSSGWLGSTRNERGEVTGGNLTVGGVEKYNALIAAYRIQFREANHMEIWQNDGITKTSRPDVFHIDAQHLTHFLQLNRWGRDRLPPDSMVMKLKERLGP